MVWWCLPPYRAIESVVEVGTRSMDGDGSGIIFNTFQHVMSMAVQFSRLT